MTGWKGPGASAGPPPPPQPPPPPPGSLPTSNGVGPRRGNGAGAGPPLPPPGTLPPQGPPMPPSSGMAGPGQQGGKRIMGGPSPPPPPPPSQQQQRGPPRMPPPMEDLENSESIYVVADSANLFSGAQMVDGKRNMDIKVNLATTLPLIDDARPIKQRVVVASFPERSNRMWRYFEQRRYQIYCKTEETEVDDELAAQICGILSHAPETYHRVLVFVTGDGNAHKGQHSFPQLVILALQRGWTVELVCWRSCLNPLYETLRNDFPSRMRLRFLDNHRTEITFRKPRMGGDWGDAMGGPDRGYGLGPHGHHAFSHHTSPHHHPHHGAAQAHHYAQMISQGGRPSGVAGGGNVGLPSRSSSYSSRGSGGSAGALYGSMGQGGLVDGQSDFHELMASARAPSMGGYVDHEGTPYEDAYVPDQSTSPDYGGSTSSSSYMPNEAWGGVDTLSSGMDMLNMNAAPWESSYDQHQQARSSRDYYPESYGGYWSGPRPRGGGGYYSNHYGDPSHSYSSADTSSATTSPTSTSSSAAATSVANGGGVYHQPPHHKPPQQHSSGTPSSSSNGSGATTTNGTSSNHVSAPPSSTSQRPHLSSASQQPRHLSPTHSAVEAGGSSSWSHGTSTGSNNTGGGAGGGVNQATAVPTTATTSSASSSGNATAHNDGSGAEGRNDLWSKSQPTTSIAGLSLHVPLGDINGVASAEGGWAPLGAPSSTRSQQNAVATTGGGGGGGGDDQYASGPLDEVSGSNAADYASSSSPKAPLDGSNHSSNRIIEGETSGGKRDSSILSTTGSASSSSSSSTTGGKGSPNLGGMNTAAAQNGGNGPTMTKHLM